jgi:hypothetical protein
VRKPKKRSIPLEEAVKVVEDAGKIVIDPPRQEKKHTFEVYLDTYNRFREIHAGLKPRRRLKDSLDDALRGWIAKREKG